MFQKIYKYILYNSLYYTIKDLQVQKNFYNITKNNYQNWDFKFFDKLFFMVNKSYNEIEKNSTNIFYMSFPPFMVLFLNDKKFVDMIKDYYKNTVFNDFENLYIQKLLN